VTNPRRLSAMGCLEALPPLALRYMRGDELITGKTLDGTCRTELEQLRMQSDAQHIQDDHSLGHGGIPVLPN
jgi:hypothetical protein